MKSDDGFFDGSYILSNDILFYFIVNVSKFSSSVARPNSTRLKKHALHPEFNILHVQVNLNNKSQRGRS